MYNVCEHLNVRERDLYDIRDTVVSKYLMQFEPIDQVSSGLLHKASLQIFVPLRVSILYHSPAYDTDTEKHGHADTPENITAREERER